MNQIVSYPVKYDNEHSSFAHIFFEVDTAVCVRLKLKTENEIFNLVFPHSIMQDHYKPP